MCTLIAPHFSPANTPVARVWRLMNSASIRIMTASGMFYIETGIRRVTSGKWHLWANQLGRHNDPQNSYIPPGEHRLGFDGEWSAYNFHHLYSDAYYHKDSPEKIVLPGYEPDGQTDLAIDYLQRASTADDPFALFLSIGTPHDPWTQDNVPAADYEMFQNVDFPLPPNYRDQNDPYGDTWAIMFPEQRAQLPEMDARLLCDDYELG